MPSTTDLPRPIDGGAPAAVIDADTTAGRRRPRRGPTRSICVTCAVAPSANGLADGEPSTFRRGVTGPGTPGSSSPDPTTATSSQPDAVSTTADDASAGSSGIIVLVALVVVLGVLTAVAVRTARRGR